MKTLFTNLLAQPDVEGLAAFFPGTYFELHLTAFAQILEVNLGRKTRAMKKDLVAAVVRDDKAETFVLDYLLDGAVHGQPPPDPAGLEFRHPGP